ncbi:Uma2 family endonuclease [Desulfonema limicola]|nr:Uma2 family endonuclease [Desulfonema limicola]
MNWTNICEDPVLQNIPYKIQTDKWGNILMSPATNEHGIYQAKIISLISTLKKTGIVISECSVQTKEGVKVADAAWASNEYIKRNMGTNPYMEAPEICIEILSPSNTKNEMEEKKELYFARGTLEFWICDKQGNMEFYKNTGKIKHSSIIKDFPGKIIIDSF